MKKHHTHNSRRLGNNNGLVYRGVRSEKPGPELPQLKPGEYRCECGAAVKLISAGLLRNHRTLLHNVPCIHSHTEPKEEPCPDIATR